MLCDVISYHIMSTHTNKDIIKNDIIQYSTVPLAYNAADLLEKVIWLKSHPKEALQLAQNARNFGLSYLRLEDYYCYMASALEAFGENLDPSALVPFNLRPVPKRFRKN